MERVTRSSCVHLYVRDRRLMWVSTACSAIDASNKLRKCPAPNCARRHHIGSFREGTSDNKTLPTIGFLLRSSKSAWASFSRFIGSKIACSRNTGYRWANKPYDTNNRLLNIATIRKGTIELMQKAASTASPAEYPSRSVADIAVGVLCVKVISRSSARPA